METCPRPSRFVREIPSELVEEVQLGGRRANPGDGEGRWVRSSGGRWGGGGFAAGEVAASGLVAEGHAYAPGQRARHGKFGEGVRKEKVRVPRSGSYSCVPWTAPSSSPTFAPLTSNRAIGSAHARMPGASPGSSSAEGARRVIGIGSAFDARRSFTHRSDIDLVVEGIDAGEFYAISARAAAMTGFRLDLTPLEAATPALRRVAREEGVEL